MNEFPEIMVPLTYWHWLIAMLVLLGLELFAPGAVFLWLGIAAGLTGVLMLVVPATPWELQVVVFSVAGVASILTWRNYRRRNPDTSDQPNLNRRGEQYIGRTAILVEAIESGTGRIRLGDGQWKVTGPDLPAGVQVRIVAVDGAVLRVEVASD